MEEDRITAGVIGRATRVHKALGPGLLESAYQIALESELRNEGFKFKNQLSFPLIYNGIKTKKGYRIDF